MSTIVVDTTINTITVQDTNTTVALTTTPNVVDVIISPSQIIEIEPIIQSVIVIDNFSVITAGVKLAGDVSGGTGALVIDTVLKIVNDAPGTFTFPAITVNEKGLITHVEQGHSNLIEHTIFDATLNQTSFPVGVTDLHFIAASINGLDYTGAFSGPPPGSGVVSYDPVVGLYHLQAGDVVVIQWQ